MKDVDVKFYARKNQEDTPEQIETGVQYLSTDALGSTRLVTKASQEVAARIDYWPFGEEIAASSSAGNAIR